MAVKSRRRRLLGLGILLGLLGAGDLGLSVLLRDGTLRGRSVPPLGALTNVKQKKWLARKDTDPSARKEILFHFDAELGWNLTPSSRSSDGLYTTNSIGARGQREYPPRPPEGTTRIVCFGDSFTMGADVPDEESYSAHVERLRPDWEALNFGVGAYGVGQALLRFRREGRDLGADVVAIGILLENIGRNVNRYRPLWYPYSTSCGTKPRFALDGEELRLVPQPFPTEEALVAAVRDGSVIDVIREDEYWLDRPWVPTGRLSSLVRVLFSLRVGPARRPERLWTDVEGEPFRVSVAVLERFHREALASGARDAPVLIFPTREALRGRTERNDHFWRSLCDELDRRGVPYLDLADPLSALVSQREIDGDVNRIYTTSSHLTGPANEAVARALIEWIEARPR